MICIDCNKQISEQAKRCSKCYGKSIKGKPKSKETRRKISNARKGKTLEELSKNPEETRRRLSKAKEGWRPSEECIRRRIKTRKENGYWKNPKETKRKIGLGNRGKGMSGKGYLVAGLNNGNWILDRKQRYEPYTEKFSDKDFRQLILEEQGNICPICNGRKIKCLHHIDYSKQNDNRENLIFLCKSCHSKTNGGKENRRRWQKKLENLNIFWRHQS